jgi:hypothetical protein
VKLMIEYCLTRRIFEQRSSGNCWECLATIVRVECLHVHQGTNDRHGKPGSPERKGTSLLGYPPPRFLGIGVWGSGVKYEATGYSKIVKHVTGIPSTSSD